MKNPIRKTSPKLLSRPELAAAFGVVPLTVSKWSAAGLPVAERGGRGRVSRYSLPAVVAWEIERRVQARGGGPAGAAIDLAQERALLARAQTRKCDLENMVRAKELLPREQVVREGRTFVFAVRAKLLAMPRRMVGAGIVPPDKLLAVRDLVYEALEEMSRWTEKTDLLAKAAEAEAEAAS